MPTPSFCALDEVYSDWNFKKSDFQTQQHARPQLQPITSQKNQEETPFQSKEQDDVYIPKNNDIPSFCPNCQNCLNANDVLQQRIVEVNTWPRPRWSPQYPNAYTPYDPFNRYWMNNVPSSHREDFGNIYENFGSGKIDLRTETLLQVILFILVALFIIQLIECLYMRCT
jgi:hypothetical protein